MLLKNLLYFRQGDMLVFKRELSGKVNTDNRLPGTPARASGLLDDNIIPARSGQEFAELSPNLIRAGRIFTGSRTDLDNDFSDLHIGKELV